MRFLELAGAPPRPVASSGVAVASAALQLPVLGLGTWRLGEHGLNRNAELRALRRAIEMGYRLFDTAEMYGEGGAEQLLGLALAQAVTAGELRRDEFSVVSKVYPHHASRQGTLDACARSLERLGLQQIDLYLLHWRGNHPLADTVAALRELQAGGAIRAWGVSNFDVDDLQELAEVQAAVPGSGLPAGGHCVCNQVYLSATERGPEVALLPWMRQHGLALMAYSPIDQGALAHGGPLARIATGLGLSPAQLALAWLLHKPGVCVIPKAVKETHQRDNLAAAEIRLDAATLAALDAAYPLPRRKPPLAMI
jgi:diketogulonate reductase-like aldo/keto reductase